MTTTLQYKERQEEDLPITMRTINRDANNELASDIEAFLAAGGEIEHIEPGVCSEMYRKKMNQDEARDYIKKTTGRIKNRDSLGRDLSPWHAMGEANYQDSQNKRKDDEVDGGK